MFPCGNISVVHCVNFPHNSHIGYRFRLSLKALCSVFCSKTLRSYVSRTHRACKPKPAKKGRGYRRGKTAASQRAVFPLLKLTRFAPKRFLNAGLHGEYFTNPAIAEAAFCTHFRNFPIGKSYRSYIGYRFRLSSKACKPKPQTQQRFTTQKKCGEKPPLFLFVNYLFFLAKN